MSADDTEDTVAILKAAEARSITEARRLIDSGMSPMAIAFVACWLNAVVKRNIEASGPAGDLVRKMLEDYERGAMERLKDGGF